MVRSFVYCPTWCHYLVPAGPRRQAAGQLPSGAVGVRGHDASWLVTLRDGRGWCPLLEDDPRAHPAVIVTALF